MSPSTRYAQKHAKARRRRYRNAHERLALHGDPVAYGQLSEAFHNCPYATGPPRCVADVGRFPVARAV